MMTPYVPAPDAKDLRHADGRIILAYGEATGHHHEVIDVPATWDVDAGGVAPAPPSPEMMYVAEPDGRRVLVVVRTCRVVHPEHGTITLDVEHPVQARQGDVLLTPIGGGAWEVVRQHEYVERRQQTVAD